MGFGPERTIVQGWTEEDLNSLVRSSIKDGEEVNLDKLRNRIASNTHFTHNLAIDLAIGRVCESAGQGMVRLKMETSEDSPHN